MGFMGEVKRISRRGGGDVGGVHREMRIFVNCVWCVDVLMSNGAPRLGAGARPKEAGSSSSASSSSQKGKGSKASPKGDPMEVDEPGGDGSGGGARGGHGDARGSGGDAAEGHDKDEKSKSSTGSSQASSGAAEEGSSNATGGTAAGVWWGDKWSEEGMYEGMVFRIYIMDEPDGLPLIDSDLDRLYRRVIEGVER